MTDIFALALLPVILLLLFFGIGEALDRSNSPPPDVRNLPPLSGPTGGRPIAPRSGFGRKSAPDEW